MAGHRNILRWLPPAAVLMACLLLGVACNAAGDSKRDRARVDRDYQKQIKPVLAKYCRDCHGPEKQKGGLSFEHYPDAASVLGDRERWAEVLRKVRSQEMPPESRAQPKDSERDLLAGWIESALFRVNCADPDPGRVTIRRLNRSEYNHTIHDLTGTEIDPAADFPADDSGYGFDNIGDALTVSPLLLEKYLRSAEKIASAIMNDDGARRRIVFCEPSPGQTNECARAVLERFARRAFRRPLHPEELDRLSGLVRQRLEAGAAFAPAVQLGLEAVLTSPHFLFRGELPPAAANPNQKSLVDEFALASRLSYFLWSSMPDDELFALAEKGRLRKQLEPQVRRMLKDPRSRALIENFGGQWLQTRNLKLVAPDASVFPGFDEELRTAMERETELFFDHVLRQDLSVLEFLNADYTFVNERLARHYGLAGVQGLEFRRVSLAGTSRRGVLSHAGILTITSNPTRTSPVKRGKWVLENFLAQAPPPPPPGVPPLKEDKADVAGASLRQRMERHRADPTCASCHAQMDPIGFSLENFDGIGAWRERDGAFPIDASGKLPAGESFNGSDGLRKILSSSRRQQFIRCLSEKMLTYALGRGLEYYDRCAVDQVARDTARGGDRFSSMILAITHSVPFQMRRGEQ